MTVISTNKPCIELLVTWTSLWLLRYKANEITVRRPIATHSTSPIGHLPVLRETTHVFGSFNSAFSVSDFITLNYRTISACALRMTWNEADVP